MAPEQRSRRIISVVGTRPEIIQLAVLSRELRKAFDERIIHTGQHFDLEMDRRFFEEFSLPEPAAHLHVGAGSPCGQLAAMIERFEPVLRELRPALLMVRGDTSSALAGALAAVRTGIPLAHVEAGERSFDFSQPEEQNRMVIDRLAGLHFCVNETSKAQLRREGISEQVHVVGDVLFDLLVQARPMAAQRSDLLTKLKLEPRGYSLVTIHRASTVDDAARLAGLWEFFGSLEERIVFPVHPRTRAALDALGCRQEPNVILLEPVGYFDMLQLESHARLIATDSGGVQREAYCLGVPCLTLREKTEWQGTVNSGWNRLVGTDPKCVRGEWRREPPAGPRPELFGSGDAARRIAELTRAYMEILRA